MIWLALFTLTALVLLLPFVPALKEWLRATDVQPVLNDSPQALHPSLQARAFAERLQAAVLAGDDEMAGAAIANVPPYGAWPLDALERRAGSSQRVWHTMGDAELPPDFGFQNEVVAGGDLTSAQRGLYRALFAGGLLRLAKRTMIKRWAHAHVVELSPGCQSSGRISADDRIHVRGDVLFGVLHAPIVRFMPRKPGPGAVATVLPAAPGEVTAGLPAPVVWDNAAARGVCEQALELPADSAWAGDLVCRSHLTLGAASKVNGSLKAHGHIAADDGCRIHGNVVAVGRIELGERCAVRGSLISETAIVLGPGCRIGAPEFPATVSAPRIDVAPGVVVHGTLWAGKSGRSRQSVSRSAALPNKPGQAVSKSASEERPNGTATRHERPAP
jgi:cytoskeletal protein CcmA (bactofilin family)